MKLKTNDKVILRNGDIGVVYNDKILFVYANISDYDDELKAIDSDFDIIEVIQGDDDEKWQKI